MSTVIITGSKTLTELNVSFNLIGDKGILVITEWLLSAKLLNIRKLDVTKCEFSMKGT